jgi:homoserine O-acetyltransferase
MYVNFDHLSARASRFAGARPLRLAIAGYGTVGQALARRLSRERDFEIAAILVRDTHRDRAFPPPCTLTSNVENFLAVPADVLVDVTSCAATGSRIARSALVTGRHVVSASKRSIRADHAALRELASAGAACHLLYSAAVGGEAPILETVEAAARHAPVARIRAVLNGTVNFVLEGLAQGKTLALALGEARRAGLAEAEASQDLDGHDAAAKLALIAWSAFGIAPDSLEVEREILDEALARRIAASGERWVQLALLERKDALACARVMFCPVRTSGLQALPGAGNCVHVETLDGRSFTCQGRGAGGAATAEAIMDDLGRIRDATAWRDVELELPVALHRFAPTTRARVGGRDGAPLVLLLGGISADRFVCDGSDGGVGWWSGIAGPGRAIDPGCYRIAGLDFVADETGLAAPTTEEQAECLACAIEQLGPTATIIGASYGGMVALALAARRPELVEKLVLVSAPASPDPAATAVREIQRRIVALGAACGKGREGLVIARGLAMLTYRTSEEFAQRFAGGIAEPDPLSISAPGAYLDARGRAYASRTTPGRFLSLSASIDRHQVDPRAVDVPTLVIASASDTLVPLRQLRDLAGALPQGQLRIVETIHGHDMFLKEVVQLGELVSCFLVNR